MTLSPHLPDAFYTPTTALALNSEAVSTFQDTTWIVTGGAGFIGHHVVRHLLALGANVVVIDNFSPYYDPALKHTNLAWAAQHPRFTLHAVDIEAADAVTAVLSEAATRHGTALTERGGVIHLAARAGVRPSLSNPQGYLATNVQGTLNLLEACRALGITRWVAASSSSVYGDSPERVPFTETQDISHTISPYAATKAMMETLLHTYHHLYGFSVLTLRFFTVYGAGQRPDLAIHQFTHRIATGQPITLFGDGTTRRDYTDIDDIVQGILSAAALVTQPGDAPQDMVINLGGSQTTRLIDLVRAIEAALDKPANIIWGPLQPGDVPITYANIHKATAVLGYQPQTPIAQGIPRFVAWYRWWQANQHTPTAALSRP